MTTLTVVITIICYFALMLGVSAYASRRGSDFYGSKTKVPGVFVALAMIGAAISGVTFVSVPGMVVAKGYSYLQMALGFIVGYVVIARVLIPLFYKHKLVSIYGYLEKRFGPSTYTSGAWLFFVSKITGAAVRFFVVCIVLQGLVFAPLGMPFEVAVIVSVLLIWLYTFRGGVKSVIWTDLLRSAALIFSVILSIIFIYKQLNMEFGEMAETFKNHSSSRIFYFDDPTSGLYFFKQFIAGIFMAVAMTGLDQDMMQRTLGCADSKASAKGMVRGGVMQFFLIALFLVLGTMMAIYVERTPGLEMPEKSDYLFSAVATHSEMPVIVGIVFIVGLVATAYSAAGSALTSLTTSFSIDILRRKPDDAKGVRKVHILMSMLLALVIIVFYHISNQDAISAVYTLASYTYGPLLGLFIWGLMTKRNVADGFVPAICIAAPVLAWLLQWSLKEYASYEIGFELLLVNAALTVAFLALVPATKKDVETAV